MCHTQSRLRDETGERVPWNTLVQRYAEVEASRCLLQRTIEHRVDPEDQQEHQFRITRIVDRRRSNCFVANLQLKA